ncbi:hypothetical protein [Ferdinandcohnia sp. Marseille-Q9671]
MDPRIQDLINHTKTKFGLHDYYLGRHSLSRNVNIFNETNYTLSMEWFPKNTTEVVDEDSNPDGTAVIEVNVHTGKYDSAIFVMGETFARDGITFEDPDTDTIIKWVEQETGLIYGKQFQVHTESEGELRFKECIEGVAVSPSGLIEVKWNQEGQLTSFSVYGHFPTEEIVRIETYTLIFEQIENLAKEQVKLLEFPSFEKEKLYPVYEVEELYVSNDGTSTIPFEVIVDHNGYLKINKTIIWDEPIKKSFERKEISWVEEVTAEQAYSIEPSPVSFPISKEEEEKCIAAVEELVRQEYPSDSGNWMLKTLHREKGYIHAILRANQQDNRVFQRKLMIMIDGETLKAVNYMDNKLMLEMFDRFKEPDQVAFTKEEAYEKLKDLFELKPYYVYDFGKKQYVLCGKIDCQYGVNAANGEVVNLDDL